MLKQGILIECCRCGELLAQYFPTNGKSGYYSIYNPRTVKTDDPKKKLGSHSHLKINLLAFGHIKFICNKHNKIFDNENQNWANKKKISCFNDNGPLVEAIASDNILGMKWIIHRARVSNIVVSNGIANCVRCQKKFSLDDYRNGGQSKYYDFSELLVDYSHLSTA